MSIDIIYHKSKLTPEELALERDIPLPPPSGTEADKDAASDAEQSVAPGTKWGGLEGLPSEVGQITPGDPDYIDFNILPASKPAAAAAIDLDAVRKQVAEATNSHIISDPRALIS